MDKLRQAVRKHAAKIATFISIKNFILFWKPKDIKMLAKLKSELLSDCPWFYIVAEPKGVLPAAPQSIAHCLENMWLKAMALGLGFRLVSIIETMGNNEELCNLLSLEKGRYALNGCTIGYPNQEIINSKRPDIASVVIWL